MSMTDPSQGIQRELLPHVHLLSTYRFPNLPSLHPEKVAEWLLSAPKIARDTAPFYWTYLDRPVDSSILLVWQSTALGTDYPSDGYIFPPAETAFQLEVAGGYMLEMYQHKAGFAPNEPTATHARRRYRLLQHRNPNVGGPSPDPAQWIIHYAHSEPQDRIPSNIIPTDMRVNQVMQTRHYLQSQGQIVQKEFMLHDRGHWPQIAFPRGPPRGPPAYAGSAPQARNIPAQMAYPTSGHGIGPPSKRARTQASSAQANANAVLDGDDEEETSRGDLFDHTSPRDISMDRYKQNHEWMEEIMSSPYSLNQIIPADLGLGLRGGLASLTDGIFNAPYQLGDKDVVDNAYIGRLEPEKAEQFRQRTNETIAKTNTEMEKMKAKHAKRMAKFQKGSVVTTSEKSLRLAVNDPSDTGPEYWRLEGRIDEEEDGDGKTVGKTPPKVADIVAQVEASVGRHMAAVQELIRLQDGGYEEAPALPTPQPAAPITSRISPPGSNHDSHSQHSGVMVGDADMDMSNSAAGLLDQYHTGMSSNATPGSNFATPQPHLQAHSSTGTPDMRGPSPSAQGQAAPHNDIKMADANDNATGTGDWVVVPPGGVSPQHGQAPASTSTPSENVHAPTTHAASNPSPMPASTTAPTSNANTPGMPDYHTSPNDFADLGDLDNAEAIATYGEMSGDLDMDVGMDDSAFGDAFHGVEQRGDEGEGDDHGDGL